MTTDGLSDEQVDVLSEITGGVAALLELLYSDPDWAAADADTSSEVLGAVTSMVWAESRSGDLVPCDKLVESGLTRKEAVIAFTAMAYMWCHLNAV